MRITCTTASYIIALLLTAGYACQSSNSKEVISYSDQVTNPADSLEKNVIVKELENTLRKVELEGKRQKISFPILNATDSIDYSTLHGELFRVSMNMDDGQGTIWPTYFLRDGELIQFRYRKLVKDSTTYFAQEILAYLHGGKIFYVEEREIDLGPDQIPAFLRLQPLLVSKRTFGEVEKLYMEYWPKLKQAVDLHFLNTPIER